MGELLAYIETWWVVSWQGWISNPVWRQNIHSISVSGVATPGPTRAQVRVKLVRALVAKAQVPAVNRFFIGLGGRRIRISKFWVTGPTRCPGNCTSLDTPLISVSVWERKQRGPRLPMIIPICISTSKVRVPMPCCLRSSSSRNLSIYIANSTGENVPPCLTPLYSDKLETLKE